MKPYLAFLIALCFGLKSQARIMTGWNYDGLNDKATLVVIATPTKVATTTERAALPDIRAGTNEIFGTGIETRFEILTVLKGDHSVRAIVLHHYKLAPTPENLNDGRIHIDMGGGPGLVSFEPKDRKIYLIFLRQEADGRYAAVSGRLTLFGLSWSLPDSFRIYYIQTRTPQRLDIFDMQRLSPNPEIG